MIDLKNLLGKNENCLIEVKSARGGFPDSFWESYSAFANSDGGTIVLGVEENKDHSFYIKDGLADAEKMKETFWKLVNNRQKISHNIVTNGMVYTCQLKGKDILVVEVPRAERTARPVYKGLDPRYGTYRRWGDGDHLCSMEEIGAMMRDAMVVTQDAKVIKGMDMSVFCKDTIRAYRQVFRNANDNHLWNNLDDEMFLRRIGAMGVAEDGIFYPTAAGLLMFGYEYEIVREFPQFFLDYQEDRVMIGATRWKDRIVSSSGDWSGNLFDFIFKILSKLCSDLKVPFVLKGMQRVDDTPVHKLIREACVNTLSHADFYGRQGIVISKNKEGFTFSNPGRLRISAQEATGGGISDPRNGIVLKMFSLIRFGERAGSGLNGIFYVWNKVFHTNANIKEKDGDVDRTILTLPFDGHEQDVDAMLKLYDNSEILVNRTNPESADKPLTNPESVDKPLINSKTADKPLTNSESVDKPRINSKSADIMSTKNNSNYKLDMIMNFIINHKVVRASEIANLLDLSMTQTRYYLNKLIEDGKIKSIGANKNRAYSIK